MSKAKKSRVDKVRSEPRGQKADRNPRRDWDKLRRAYIESDLSLRGFCRANDIPYTTAKRHLSAKQKEEILKGAKEIAAGYNAKIAKSLGEELGKLRVSSLKKFYTIADKILEGAAQDFVLPGHTPGWNSQGEAARVAIQAGETLRSVADELSGIPPDDEDFGWPLTKGFSPFWYQRDFVLDFPSSVKQEQGLDMFIAAFIAGIGSGKTRCGAEKFGDLCWRNRGTTLGVFAPTYRMLEDATKAELFACIRRKNLSFKYHKTDNAITIFGDTRVLFRSMDKPDHLRGPNLSAAWIDEALQMRTREAFDVILGRVRAPEAKEKMVVVTGTPDGLNWGYDVLVDEAIQNKVRLYHGRTTDNPLLGDYADRLMDIYDDRLAKQELLGEWLNIFAGQAYWNFERQESVVPEASIKADPSIPIILAVDFNVDPMSWNIGQERKHNGGKVTYWIDELHIRTAGTDVATREFINRWGAHRAGVKIYGDATGRARATNATRTDYEIIENMLKAAKVPYEIYVGRSNPRETDRISAVNARLKNARGKRRMFFTSNLKWTIRDFEKVGFIPGTRQIDKTDKTLTHHSDGIGYYTDYEFPIRGVRVQYGRGN
jgi:hypothetical protein